MMREVSILFWCTVFITGCVSIDMMVRDHWLEIKAAITKRWHG